MEIWRPNGFSEAPRFLKSLSFSILWLISLLNVSSAIRLALPFLSGFDMIVNQIYIMSREGFVSRYFWRETIPERPSGVGCVK